MDSNSNSRYNGVLTGVNVDVDRRSLFELTDVELNAVSASDKYATNIVCNEVFWKQKVEQTYGEKVVAAKLKEMTYKEQYFTLPKFVNTDGSLSIEKRYEAAVKYDRIYILEILKKHGYR